MNKQQFERLIQRLDRQMVAANRRGFRRRFTGLALSHAVAGDTPPVMACIAVRNHKARAYNRLGGELRRRIQDAVDRHAPNVRPVDDFLSAIVVEWASRR